MPPLALPRDDSLHHQSPSARAMGHDSHDHGFRGSPKDWTTVLNFGRFTMIYPDQTSHQVLDLQLKVLFGLFPFLFADIHQCLGEKNGNPMVTPWTPSRGSVKARSRCRCWCACASQPPGRETSHGAPWLSGISLKELAAGWA